MKKIAWLLSVVMAMAILLAGCGGTPATTDGDATPTPAPTTSGTGGTPQTSDVGYFRSTDKRFGLGLTMGYSSSKILSLLWQYDMGWQGDPVDGTDSLGHKIVTFVPVPKGGVMEYQFLYPEGETDPEKALLQQMMIGNEGFEIVHGLKIGDTEEALLAVFNETRGAEGDYLYKGQFDEGVTYTNEYSGQKFTDDTGSGYLFVCPVTEKLYADTFGTPNELIRTLRFYIEDGKITKFISYWGPNNLG